jgi:2-keto-3-deoxy-L-rhamnonate aldolase RhmA
MYRENALKRRLAEGKKCLGAWSMLGSPGATEIMALAGFDFLILDHEHGPATLQDLGNELRAISATRTTAIMRAPELDIGYLKRALDLGVEGIMMPNVGTAEEARRFVAACRYPPQGFRGSAYGAARAASFGREAAHYRDTINDNLVLIAQIESKAAVENIEAIAGVEGIDVLFIGVNDLAGSIGKLHDLDDPGVLKLCERAEAGIKRGGKRLGGIPFRGLDCAGLFRHGYDLAAGFVDVIALLQTSNAAAAAHRSEHP